MTSTERITTARHSCAWCDRTGQTLLTAAGADRIDLLHRLSTNDLTGLSSGQGKSTVLLTEKARIVDVLTVLQLEHSAMILGSRGSSNAVLQWIRKYIIMDDVQLRDVTASTEMIEICGPRAANVIEELTGVNVGTMALSHWMPVDPGTNTILFRMPSAAELSYWILGPVGSLTAYRDVLHSSDDSIPKLHDEDVEYLRVTAGIGQIGHEWTDSYNPLEAGLLHLTSFNKGCYIGQEVVARLDSYNKVKQRLMGLKGADVFATGDELQVDGIVVGRVTSVVPSIHGDCWYGLGYVRGEHANVGVSLAIQRETSVQYVVQQLLPMEN